MTLRILSPSRHGAREDKSQVDQENRPAEASAEPPLPSPALSRAGNLKTSPKRRRLPLRDSILLKRRDSPDSPKRSTSTSATAPRNHPEPPTPKDPESRLDSQPRLKSTLSKSRLKGFPRLGPFARDQKPVETPQQKPVRPPRPDEFPNVREPAITSEKPLEAGEKLVSRICTMILDEGVGAGDDRSSTALKVWDAVAKCLDGITQPPSTESGGKVKPVDAVQAKTVHHIASADRTSSTWIHPWPPESWKARAPVQVGTGRGSTPANDASNKHGNRSSAELNSRFSTISKQSSEAEKKMTATATATATPLPCPFRARNPVRFNVNDSWHCAQGQWKNLADLQQHIARHHRHRSESQLFQCPRCERGFSEPSAFKKHLTLPRDQMCDPRSEFAPMSSDPEDGITSGRARALSEGVERGKIGSWDDLWKCLFPADRMVPRPAILPAIELPQVEQEIFANDNMCSLKTSLEERLVFLASQSSNSEMLLSQIPVITGSISLVLEAHLRSVFIACRNKPSGQTSRSRSASQSQEIAKVQPRSISSASSASLRSLEKPEARRPPALKEAKSFVVDELSRHRQPAPRSFSDGSHMKHTPRSGHLPMPWTLTIPFPRISALSEQSDMPGSHNSDDGNASPKGQASDGEYSSGVESNPTSAGGLRDSNNTDIRCSKCNMRPSLRPNEEVFAEHHLSQSPVHGTQDSSCRFSDSGIGILCRNCRMLEELINSYSRASLQSARSERRTEEVRTKDANRVAPMSPFSPDPSVSVDENDEETLFDLILDSAAYVDGDGQRKTALTSPMFPPPRQDLPPGGFPEFDRYGQDGNFF
ncbi:hypothetical protein CTRI78_v003516 [Colletotrichum trifolii]|uniref:C2H2-type domain-containing protein n=1 Tax=Colletotrichum trifolii TaxID=5466 RepID=A0A4R8RNV3_COLTR|nr:hypothetical protein CTRI78_v003516 [Colletotrichum trifolii]